MKKIIIVAMIMTCIVCVCNKANKTRECEVFGVCNEMISVIHPNGYVYTTTLEQEDIGRYHKGAIVDVVFDELCDWEKNYIAKKVKR